MDGTDFLLLAGRLSVGVTEAERRTSVSRAYYGVFHLACDLVRHCGVLLPKTADAHNKLHWCLSQAQDAEIVSAANMLSSLRAARNAGDYDLEASAFQNQVYIEQQLKIAQLIAAEFLDCRTRADFASSRLTIRKYACETLRLKTIES